LVAGPVAGLGPAGQAVVRLRGIALGYAGLAAASLSLAMLLPHAPGRVVPAAGGPLYVYQHLLGPYDGRACPSWPVCSLYARQAFVAHGLVLGSWLMLDRLIHEADDLRRGPWLLAADGKRIYDPLSRNDFWLRRGESPAQAKE
jgi:Putative membrane protein insertion efficiency factor